MGGNWDHQTLLYSNTFYLCLKLAKKNHTFWLQTEPSSKSVVVKKNYSDVNFEENFIQVGGCYIKCDSHVCIIEYEKIYRLFYVLQIIENHKVDDFLKILYTYVNMVF